MSTLTQEQINKTRESSEDYPNFDELPETLRALCDMAETLLALEWATEAYPDPHCDSCPMYKPNMCPLFDVALLARGGNKTWCQELAFLHKSEWLKAYRERGAE